MLSFPYHSGSILSGSVNDILIKFIIGLFGLWDEMYYPLAIILKEKERLGFPLSLIQLLKDLQQNLEDHPYSATKTAEECRKIEQGITYLHSHPRLQKALSEPPKSQSPRWMEEWKKGDTLYIDLTEEDKEMQTVIIAGILNYICQVIPSSNAQVPSGIIILDELPYVFNNNPEKYLSAFQLAEWLEKTVRDELRFRYISIISLTFSPNTISPSFERLFQKVVNYWEFR